MTRTNVSYTLIIDLNYVTCNMIILLILAKKIINAYEAVDMHRYERKK